MTPHSKTKRRPVIIDTDPGVDDILAILLALTSLEIEVRAIIITFGKTSNTDVDAAYLNILRLSQVLSRQFEIDAGSRQRFPGLSPGHKIMLAKGANHPLEGDLHSAQYFHGRDGVGGISERFSDFDVAPDDGYPGLGFTNRSGMQVALDVINSEPDRSVTYITLGPLTTLAQLAREHGDVLGSKIGQIVSMGGALDAAGNATPVAEFNYFADPYAVRELLNPSDPQAGIPLNRFYLLPLDITTPHELPFPFYQTVVDPSFRNTKHPSDPKAKSPLVHFTSAFFERTREVMVSFGKDAMELHDIVAVWFAIENAPLHEGGVGHTHLKKPWRAVVRRFEVERTGELTRGMLVVDRRETKETYDPTASYDAVQAALEKHVAQQTWSFASHTVPAQVEIENPPTEPHPLPGVPVVVQTPGPTAILKLLVERVWGAEMPR